MIKEACVESYLEAKSAAEKGANRIELCENLAVGGTTPSYGTIKSCLKNLKIPTFVMIRPRGGDFVYSKDEIEIMEEDIKICKELGVKGIVYGFLNEDMTIDYELLARMVKISKPMEITFHKAIDEVENPVDEVLKLAKLGVKRILTSGKCITALEGSEMLNRMIKIGENKIKIVVAGRVTIENLKIVSEKIPNLEYHGKKIV